MTTTPVRPAAGRIAAGDVPRVLQALESDFGRLPAGLWDPRHHYLLDALDRGEHARFVVWGNEQVRAVVHLGSSGTVVAAGAQEAAPDLGAFLDRSRWRILIGDEPIASALLTHAGRSWWRRRPSQRIQRFLVCDDNTVPQTRVAGFRRAWRGDLPILEEFACRLHVEDRMGPPLVGAARSAVRQRMADSVDRGTTWVVERGGIAVAKADLALHSHRRGTQIAGVYVDGGHRGQGIASAMIATLSRELLARVPVVSLHVRDDNAAALTAYRRAGFVERGRWLLALR